MTDAPDMEPAALEAARTAYRKAEENPHLAACHRCGGRGYHHGFGEKGADPDWCLECGGGGYDLAEGEQNRPLDEAIRAYLAARSAPEAGKAVDWETFSDPAYFDMWCVRQKDAPFGDGYHVASEAEAKSLAERLSALAAPQPVAPTGEIAGLVRSRKSLDPKGTPKLCRKWMDEAATALASLSAERDRANESLREVQFVFGQTAGALERSEAEAADLRRKLEEHQDAEDKAAREMATVIQGLRNRATAAERKLEEARKVLEAGEQKIVELYRVATPHGNYDDELTINGHRSGNNFADGDETVIAIRSTLSGASE